MALSDCQLKQLRCSVLSFGYCAAMRRRDFIILATAWPLVAHAQQVQRLRSIGILLGVAADDPQGKAILGALLQGLQEFGWVDGRNAKIYYRGVTIRTNMKPKKRDALEGWASHLAVASAQASGANVVKLADKTA
jgi:putative tryptophan/tyrosine transport system substrate-binding protein